MNPLMASESLSSLVEVLTSVLGSKLSGVVYWCLLHEATPESVLAERVFHGGYTELRFGDASVFSSWAENAGWPDHFSLSVEPRPNNMEAIRTHHEAFDAIAGRLWRRHHGSTLVWARVLGWNATPHVVELGFDSGAVVIGDGYQEPFGDGDDLVHWPATAFWADPRAADVRCLWRSPSAPEQPHDGGAPCMPPEATGAPDRSGRELATSPTASVAFRKLLVVVRDTTGRLAYQAIGPAIVEADIESKLTDLARRHHLAMLAEFSCYSPRQAAHAKGELWELGDVRVDEDAFVPTFFEPEQGMLAVEGLLKHGRAFSPALRAELTLLRRVLEETARRGCKFHLLEPDPGESLPFGSVHLAE